MVRELLTKGFKANLADQGFPIGDILIDIAQDKSKKPSPLRVIRNWTGLPYGVIKAGIVQTDRDILSPRVNEAVLAVLQPWVLNEVDGNLPTVQVREIARATRFSPEKVIGLLSAYPLTFSVNGSSFATSVGVPEFPDRRLTLTDCKEFGLSPARVARSARYQSRAPGGGPVQKASIQERDIDKVIRRKALEGQDIFFNKNQSIDKVEITPEIEAAVPMPRRTLEDTSVEEIIYSEPKGAEIMQVLKWFRSSGGKDWIKGNQLLFARRLINLAQGKDVDFLIWNCVGLSWEQREPNKYPSTKVINNLDTAITYYFRKRIQEMIEQLSTIGNPRTLILVPTNEALADGLGIWSYVQSPQEREQLMNDTVEGFASIIDSIQVPSGIQPVRAQRWDQYLVDSLALDQTSYTLAGIEKLMETPNFDKRLLKAIAHAQTFFGQYGVKVDPSEEVGLRQLRYLGVYAGEGVASKGNSIGERGVVWVNFEEGNIKEAEYTGASGDIAIVTPTKNSEINEYYRWKRKVIGNRDKSAGVIL